MKTWLNQGFIEQSCREFAGLEQAQIQAIIDVAKNIPYFVEANDGDVFIDIVNEREDAALVIAELFSPKTSYRASFMGDRIYRKDEPAAFQAYESNERVMNMAGISYEKQTKSRILTKQTVIPIRHREKAVAVLILEKALDYEMKTKASTSHAAETVSDVLLSIIGLREGMEGHVREGILLFDTYGCLVYRNSMAAKIYKEIGYEIVDHLHFDSLNLLVPNFSQLILQKSLKENDAFHVVHEEHLSIGEKSYDIRILTADHSTVKLAMLIDDYPYLSKYENEIKNHLVTYKEIHHRIKNNLQTIASLLRLQSYQCEDEYAYNVLQSSISRILSIAVTHDLLAIRNGDKVSILEITKKFIKSLEQQGYLDSKKIKVTVRGDDFAVDSQKSSIILQVINELLQNSIKYAFPGGQKGQVTVTVSDEGDVKVIELRDDGVGYDPKSVKEDSLGLTIVTSYVEDLLAGKLLIASGPEGTCTSFACKL